MGAGKTTVGSRLARRLDRPFVDSDDQVERRTGRTVRQIFEQEGEDAFRAHEAEALAEALASEQPAVIAAAGGTVLDGRNRQRMRDGGTVVWLRAAPHLLVHRAQQGEHRPLLADDPRGVIDRLVVEREALYEEVADLVVDIDDRSPDDIVDHLLGCLS